MGKSKVNVRSLHFVSRTTFFQERPSEFYLIIIWLRCFCAADTGGNYGNVTAGDDNGECKVSEERKIATTTKRIVLKATKILLATTNIGKGFSLVTGHI